MPIHLVRKNIFRRTAPAIVGVSATVTDIRRARAAPTTNRHLTASNYPVIPIAKVDDIKQRSAVNFRYPDASSPCAMVKLGKPVVGGVGPDNDIVAYSTMCTHMGCPIKFDGRGAFKCGCHYGRFDLEKGGEMVCNHAAENLPRIELQYSNENDMLVAVGVTGRIYGRQSNLL